jgi:hypothetical protein
MARIGPRILYDDEDSAPALVFSPKKEIEISVQGKEGNNPGGNAYG